MFVVLTYICSKKDLSIFMKVGSFGVIFIIFLIIFIVATGFIAINSTDFKTGTMEESNDVNWANNERILVLFNSNFSPLAGILCAGYFLHSYSVPILRSSKNPEKNHRDIFLGYLFVFLSYAVCGTMGYIGFVGYGFKDYYLGQYLTARDRAGQIDQNCLNMYDYTDVWAFIMRIAIFLLIFSSYPLLHYFTSTSILKLAKIENPSDTTNFLMNVAVNSFPMLFALFYPNIGTILSYIASISGFLAIYLLPVMVHLKIMRTKLENPLLGEALQVNEFHRSFDDKDQVYKIAVDDDFLARKTSGELGDALLPKRSEANKGAWCRYYLQVALHSFIPVYGFLIMLT